MANQNNLTIYQRLNKVLNGSDTEQTKFVINRELLKDLDPQSYEREKLEAQQSLFLQGLWKKIDNELYQKAVFYEPTRIASYYDFEAMEFSVNETVMIPTPNGFESIKDLAKRGRDYEFITYAYDHNKKQVVPALARNVHYTRDEMTYKITFDDDTFIIATYGHRFLKRDGVYCKVEDLKIGDSMMPFYRKSFFNNDNYNWVYTCNSKVGHHGWVPEHTLVAEYLIRPLEENEVVHHKDFNGKNNLVENLQIMNDSEHQAFHARHNNEKLWANPEYRAKMSEVSRRTDNKYHWEGKRSGVNNPAYFDLPINDIIFAAIKFKTFQRVVDELKISRPKIRRTINAHGYLNWGELLQKNNIESDGKYNYKSLGGKESPSYQHIPWDLLVDTALKHKTAVETARQLNVTWHKVMDDVKRAGYADWKTFIDAYDTTKTVKQEKDVLVNHKIKSIEPYGIVPVYDLTVPGYKNFATDTIFSHNTPEIGAALDLYMEESCTANESGTILQIYSESDRIKKILEELFFDVLDISSNLPPWTRNIPVREDSPIPLLNGEIITIKELSDRIKNNPDKDIWTYSIQDKTHNIVAGKIIWCDLTRKDSELYRVTLDDGTYIDTTPDHEFMLRNGKYERADSLKSGVSLMPFYTKISHRPEDCIGGYEKVYNPMSDHFKFTHTAVAHECVVNLEEEELINEKIVTHHIDFNKLNNYPSNLQRMTMNVDKSFMKAKAISLAKTSKVVLNHKVLSVKKLTETSDVYCMEVVGQNGEQDRHNFPICSRNSKGEFTRNGTFVSNCKYGDNFVYLKILPNKGVIGCKQLPNIEMTRVEPDFQKVTSLSDLNREPNVKFFWKNKDLEFNSFEMAHFRLLGDDRRLPYGTCLKGNTYIDTDFGVKEIKDIQTGDLVWSFDLSTQKRVLSPVLDTIYSGVKLCYKVSTKHNIIEASEEHKILTLSTDRSNFVEKNVADLTIGDFLIIDKTDKTSHQIPIFKDIPKENKNGWFNSVSLLPDYVDTDFARFFGFMLGDGWISGNGVYFALSKYDEMNDYYAGLLNRYTANPVKYTNNTQAYAWSKSLKYVLQSMGFLGKATAKRIPKWVYELPSEIQESFIQGLIDADGWVTTDKWSTHINIELSNKELLEDLKIMVQRLGYKSGSVRERTPRKIDTIIEGRKLVSIQPSYMLTFYYTELTQAEKFNPLERKSNEYIIEPIISIDAIGDYDTYDIYVENENHNFYANGVVVHNSMLDKARRIWKQLMMSEDAMLTYRISRAAERRIYKIFVGNMDDKDIDAYIDKVANTFRRVPVVDGANGQVDLRYNMLPVWKNTPIPLLDGRTITIEELSKEYKSGKENWVYSVQDKTKSIVAGKVIWCDKNYTAQKLIKIWLDDNTWMMVAPEHPMVLRDGTYKPASDLKSGDSLMPYYAKKSSIEDGYHITGYDMVFNPKSGKYKYVHRMVANEVFPEGKEEIRSITDLEVNSGITIHHKDFNKCNNNPSNLEWIGTRDHLNYHKLLGTQHIIAYNKSDEKREQNRILAKEQNWHERFYAYNHSDLHASQTEIRRSAMISDWAEPERRSWRESQMKVHFDEYVFEKINENILSKRIIGRATMLEYLSSDLIGHIISINNNKRLNNLKKIERTVLEREINQRGFQTIGEYVDAMQLNHKVLRIEEFYGSEDVYCMTVVGANGEDDRHNFAMKSFNIDGSVSVSGSFTRNSVDQDIFIPSRDPALPNPIDTLPGAQNLDAIADIKYIQNKLLTALRIPRPFIGFDEAQGDGKNLAMMDVRFARTIYRIQKALIQELNKIAIIHLYLKGFEDELNNFTLTLTNPSTQQDLLKIERWREKVMLYRDAVTSQDGGFAAMSATKAKKEILDMSDDEIKLDIQRQAVEKAATEELKVLAETIKQTGIFKDIYDIYNIDPNNLTLQNQGDQGAGAMGGGGSGGGGGGGGIGGGLLGEPTPPAGEEGTPPAGEEGIPPAGEEGAMPAGEEGAPPEPEKEALKEQFFRNGRNLRLEAQRVSKRLETRNFILNEDVKDMVDGLKGLDGEKMLLQ